MQAQDYATIAVAVMTIIGGFAGAVRWMVKHYLIELKPNGGSSVKDWSDRLKRFIASFFLAVTLSGCGYQGWVRYPCQSYENWDKPECNPPQCISTGTCTENLIPEGTLNG